MNSRWLKIIMIDIFDIYNILLSLVADCSGWITIVTCFLLVRKHFQIPFQSTDIICNNDKSKFLQTTKTFRTMEQQVTIRSSSLSELATLSSTNKKRSILQKSLCTQWSWRATNSGNKLSLFNQTCLELSGKWNFEKGKFLSSIRRFATKKFIEKFPNFQERALFRRNYFFFDLMHKS